MATFFAFWHSLSLSSLDNLPRLVPGRISSDGHCLIGGVLCDDYLGHYLDVVDIRLLPADALVHLGRGDGFNDPEVLVSGPQCCTFCFSNFSTWREGKLSQMFFILKVVFVSGFFLLLKINYSENRTI